MKFKENQEKSCFFYRMLIIIALLIPSIAFAQNHQVTGTVIDQQGEPIIGASVFIKGSTIGTNTDIYGKYMISLPQGTTTLSFSFVGMTSQDIPVAGKSVIDVTLKEEDNIFKDVIVIGYGTIQKKDLTTAVASVKSEEWADKPIISAQQALQGKAAGVQVMQPSGKPGVGMSIRVRGATSISASNSPLYVVDGIQTTDITNLAPSDIESMQILKDASSAAIYGASGANGVVLITTKKGRSGRAQVDVNIYAGFSNVSKQLKTLNSKQYFDLLSDIGLTYDNTVRTYTNWADETYGTGSQQNYQASVSGGNDKTTYYISGGYQNENGIIAPASYDRYSFRTNITTEVKPWFKINANASFARNKRFDAADNANAGRGGVIMSVLNTPPTMTIWDESNPGQYALNPYQASNENPLAQASTYDKNQDYRFMGNVELDFTITSDLHFKPSFSADYTSHTWDKFIDPVKTQYGRQANGRGEHANDDYLTWTSENVLSYAKKFDDKHNVNAIAGVTMKKYRHNNAYMSAEDFAVGTTFDVMTLNMANKINDAKTTRDGNTQASYLARVQYDYESRYLLSASFRADGSSKLYHKWAYYPAVSAGWRFSSEKFFEPFTKVVDDAKLRIGYGRSGNQEGIGNYDIYDKYSITRQETIGQGPSVTIDRLGNRNLRWETTTQYNLGLDLTLFSSRLTGEFDVYYKKTTDLLMEINLPTTIGTKLPLRNDGEMLNKGFEFNLNGKILTGEVKWDAGVNMSFNKNKLLKTSLTPLYYYNQIESMNNGYAIISKAGLAMGTFYGWISEGVDPETGDIIYKDINNNGITGDADPGDRTIIGCAQPDFTFGMTHSLSWKDFTLSAFFQGSYGNDILNATRAAMTDMTDYKNQSVDVLDRWQRPGMISDIPRAGNAANTLISSRYIEDGSYIRLKSLTLSYNINRKLLQPFGVERMNIYTTATNLFTLTKYRGYDPELNSGGDSATNLGIDMGTYPQTRSFIFGVNLTF